MNQIDSMSKLYECNRFIRYRFEFTSSFGLLATYEEHDQDASALGRSQSAVSHSLKKLREALDDLSW